MTTRILPIRLRAALHVARLSAPDLIQFGRGVVAAMTDNPSFPSPRPTLATLMAATDDLSAAQTGAQTRATGAAALRDLKRLVLIELLQRTQGYVQEVADADPDAAASIIESASLDVARHPVTRSRVFELRPGRVSGSMAVLAPRAGDRASYEWQLSTDGGATWTTLPATLRATTSIDGLPAFTRIEVRYRAVTKLGESDWSAPEGAVVL